MNIIVFLSISRDIMITDNQKEFLSHFIFDRNDDSEYDRYFGITVYDVNDRDATLAAVLFDKVAL